MSCTRYRDCDRARRRRASVYVMVLGITTLIALLAISAAMAARLTLKSVAVQNDGAAAAALAESAVDYALSKLAADTNWRTTYSNGSETARISVGRGTISFKLVNEGLGLTPGAGSIATNTFDPVRIYGYGRVGSAVRIYSVRLRGATPLDVMRTTIATAGEYQQAAGGILTTVGGPVSANGKLQLDDVIAGKAEASTQAGSKYAKGGVMITSPKAFPPTTLFDAYARLATTIPFPTSGSSNVLSYPLLSAAVNPSGSGNALGIYCISVPKDKTLDIQVSRIRGTLLIDCADGANVTLKSMICWEPEFPDLPILLIRHVTSKKTTDIISPPAGTITEVLSNLNPPSTPYNGNSNILPLVTDSYPSQLKGLIHITCPTGNPAGSTVEVDTYPSVIGTLLTDTHIKAKGAEFRWDANLYANPPVGYTMGPAMIPVPGTWRWEVLP